MTRRQPRVPGLSDEWAQHQLDLLEQVALNPAQAYAQDAPALTPELIEAAAAAVSAAPVRSSPPSCGSCTVVATVNDGADPVWQCDPDRPGCPLHDVPELTRERGAPCRPYCCDPSDRCPGVTQ